MDKKTGTIIQGLGCRVRRMEAWGYGLECLDLGSRAFIYELQGLTTFGLGHVVPGLKEISE